MTADQANLMQVSMICVIYKDCMFHTKHNKNDCNATLLLLTDEINTSIHLVSLN